MQAQRLADRLRGEDLEGCRVLYYSASPRARATARTAARALPEAALREDEDLCECRNLPHPRALSFGPDGESFEDFRSRVHAALQRFAERHAGETVVAVTHGGFIGVSLLALFDVPRPGTGARLDPDYTSLTEWQARDGIWRLVRYNVV